MTEARGATRVLVMAATGKARKIKDSLKPEHEEMVRLRLSGMSALQIQKETGLSKTAVYQRLAHPDVRSAIAAYQEAMMDEVADVLRKASGVAAQYLADLAGDTEEESRERRMAAIAILDRSGHGPTSRTEVTGADGATLGIVLKAEEFEAERDRLMAELEEAKAE